MVVVVGRSWSLAMAIAVIEVGNPKRCSAALRCSACRCDACHRPCIAMAGRHPKHVMSKRQSSCTRGKIYNTPQSQKSRGVRGTSHPIQSACACMRAQNKNDMTMTPRHRATMTCMLQCNAMSNASTRRAMTDDGSARIANAPQSPALLKFTRAAEESQAKSSRVESSRVRRLKRQKANCYE